MNTISKNDFPIRIHGMFLLVALFLATSIQAAPQYSSKRQARKAIDKTSYIIEEAYSVSDYFYFYSPENDLSRAVYYNRFAMQLYNRRNYNDAIYYTLRARQYALWVMDHCDDYWEYYYYTYFGWSRYYGYNPYYHYDYGSGFRYADGYQRGYGNGYQDGYADSRYVNYYNQYSAQNTSNGNARRERDPNRTVSPNGLSAGNASRNVTRAEDRQRSNYRNLDIDRYFDASEKQLLSNLPAVEAMDATVQRELPNAQFDDKTLKNDANGIKAIRQSAEQYSRKDVSSVSRMDLVSPERMRPESAITPTRQESIHRDASERLPVSARINENKVIRDAPATRLQRKEDRNEADRSDRTIDRPEQRRERPVIQRQTEDRPKEDRRQEPEQRRERPVIQRQTEDRPREDRRQEPEQRRERPVIQRQTENRPREDRRQEPEQRRERPVIQRQTEKPPVSPVEPQKRKEEEKTQSTERKLERR